MVRCLLYKHTVQITPYLYFKGDCELALAFYEACGLGKVRELRRYAGTPMAERAGAVVLWVREEHSHLQDVLEATAEAFLADAEQLVANYFLLEDPDEVTPVGIRLYASDGPDSEPMKGCAIFIESEAADRAQTLFLALSAGGRITVPFKKQFWGEHYGNFTDQFGVYASHVYSSHEALGGRGNEKAPANR